MNLCEILQILVLFLRETPFAFLQILMYTVIWCVAENGVSPALRLTPFHFFGGIKHAYKSTRNRKTQHAYKKLCYPLYNIAAGRRTLQHC